MLAASHDIQPPIEHRCGARCLWLAHWCHLLPRISSGIVAQHRSEDIIAIVAATTAFLLWHSIRSAPGRSIALITGFLILLCQGLLGYAGWPESAVRFEGLPLAVMSMVAPFTLAGLMLALVFGPGDRLHINLSALAAIQTFRIFIEGFLFMSLYEQEGIPREMTILGRNPDILVGITAPVVALLHWRGHLSPGWLLLWNLMGLGCLLNIVIVAILSMPTGFQIFGIGQPNVAVLRFPFMLLPAFLVPLAFLSHLYSVWMLSRAALLKAREPSPAPGRGS